ncbi:hypothetical protein SAMN05216257_10168 [Meinhardsimonia xiamenensis]|uniref:Glycosyltransferase n=2 Tax=Meinhardsimonia xiamenensis TaxID=990712 RepID=A0A1G8XU85_9RHOB|nr:hypothetical protein LV81_00824 [Meinhardsimonia xiamenensis]SDJ94192.1 hypothetical protein SAMN05216257_10168 [Meinhardsimonia xiamenensis]
MRRGHLIVMLKEPRPGRVKTRLARGIGTVAAAWWVRHQTARLLRRLEDRRWRLVLAVSPDTARGSRAWPAHLPRMPQGRGHLGRRMMRVMRAMPAGPALVVGGDIPALGPGHIARAFRALGSHDAVLGPAEDGGYWAIGLAHPRRWREQLLDGVRWSSEHALADTRARLGRARVALIDLLADVDEPEELRAIGRDGRRAR